MKDCVWVLYFNNRNYKIETIWMSPQQIEIVKTKAELLFLLTPPYFPHFATLTASTTEIQHSQLTHIETC